MSLEETRDGEVAVAEPAIAEIAAETAEKPKVTRRRTVKKDDDAAPKTPAKTKTTTAKTTRKTTKTAAETLEAQLSENAPAESSAEEVAPKKVTRRRTLKRTPEEEAALQAEVDAAILDLPTTKTAETAQLSLPVAEPKVAEPPISETPISEAQSAPQSASSETAEPQAQLAPISPAEPTSDSAPNSAPIVAETASAPSDFAPSGSDSAPAYFGGESGGFAPREDGFRTGRMSYRERRALRRAERLQNRDTRPPRIGPDGAPLPYENGAPREGLPRENTLRENGPRENGPRDNGPRENGRFEREGFENREGRRERDSRDRDNRDREGRERDGFGRDRFERGPRRRDLDLQSLEAMGDEELRALAGEMNVEAATEDGEVLPKSQLVMALLEAQAQAQNATLKTGILDIINDNKAYLRCDGYHPGEGDVYVSNTQIKRFGLKPGDLVLGSARAPKDNERFHGLLRVEAVNGLSVEAMRNRRDFEKLTPIFPDERFVLETGPGNITARIIDLISPVGKGQRGLIVAPPKAGKTTLIKSIANSITQNYPDVKLFVLLIDERPEEVTDISRSVIGEVVASTFDETPDNHMRVAEIVMERAKRLAEMKHDVVILMDSITRLSRASNLVVSPSGRTLSGGLDPAAMYKPKRMFGAARNIEEGGSLTILATALVDTGSRMDEMIFEEFKGTGNMDLVLDRDLFNQRIFPAIDINRSGTRRDDLLMSKEELAATYHLRRTLAQLDNDKAVTLLIDRLKNTKTNAHFMEVVAKSARQQQQNGG